MRSALVHDFTRVEEGLMAIADRPILTVFGQRNDPLHFQPRWRAVGSDVEQVVIPGGYHFPMCDAPQAVANAITDWAERRVHLRSEQPAESTNGVGRDAHQP
jgi:pimeloyl-ACP methyl ester carboxylesterase